VIACQTPLAVPALNWAHMKGHVMSKDSWAAQTPAGWCDKVDSWEWVEWREGGAHLGWRKWGPCPRCGDLMAVYQESIKALESLDLVPARCNCAGTHANRPDGVNGGCGAGYGQHIRIRAKAVS
jgi:hypothetical protein